VQAHRILSTALLGESDLVAEQNKDNQEPMLEDLLLAQKSAILDRWSELILETYPVDSRKFFRTQQDRFANPVGANIREGIEGLFDGLVQGIDTQSEFFSGFLDQVIRIRAVQEFSPAKAVGFVFLLKTAIRQVLDAELEEKALYKELMQFESRIDGLALLAFNVYMQCRESLFEVRVNEIRSRVSRIVERACQKYGMPSEWGDPENDKQGSLT
jgi:hypothetical protein